VEGGAPRLEVRPLDGGHGLRRDRPIQEVEGEEILGPQAADTGQGRSLGRAYALGEEHVLGGVLKEALAAEYL
jgi:hypothetical protein